MAVLETPKGTLLRPVDYHPTSRWMASCRMASCWMSYRLESLPAALHPELLRPLRLLLPLRLLKAL